MAAEDTAQWSQDEAFDEGTLVSVLICADCKRPESVQLELTEVALGRYLCADCMRRHLNAGDALIRVSESGGGDLVSTNSPGASSGAVGSLTRPLQTAIATALPPSRVAAPPKGSYYATLNVSLNASQEEIKIAYEAMKAFWQDQLDGANKNIASDELNTLAIAYATLRSVTKRTAYDEKLLKDEEEKRRQRVPALPWIGHHVNDIPTLVAASEDSANDWEYAMGQLKSRGLITWLRMGLQADLALQRIVEEVMERPDYDNSAASLTHALNETLYRIDPTRPFRCFASPDRFQKPDMCDNLASVDQFIGWADKHWSLAADHLYRGELARWLDVQMRNRYVTEVDQSGFPTGRTFENVSDLYQRNCIMFKGGSLEGVGLENFLEQLDHDLPRPKLVIDFDGDTDGYTLDKWDDELSHKPIILTIRNTTRGYVAGAVTLAPVEQRDLQRQRQRNPWVDFNRLPQPPYLVTPSTTTANTPQVTVISPKTQTLTLQGDNTATYKLELGAFNALYRGKWYERSIAVTRYITSPTTGTLAKEYPIKLRLMNFLGGYRLALWRLGLRGGLPGGLLDGVLAYAVTWAFLLLALLCAPHGQWSLFNSGNSGFLGFINGLLVLIIRPFGLPLAAFGYSLPWIVAVVFAFVGLRAGARSNYTQFKENADATLHVSVGLRLMGALWLYGIFLMIINLAANARPVITLPGGFKVSMILYYLQNSQAALPPIFGVSWLSALLSAFAGGIVAYLVARIIANARSRLYAFVARENASLLNPPGKADA
jgi:hypothetical protein